ncbi:MAG: YdcF family protein [Candidatus Omnitrophica bacterium]|nr:YdcF family protein [Candidatus Omnitrophota bacterium]MBI3021873.1 YdcF family protein [Candidatus Omnitrophota bacterium]
MLPRADILCLSSIDWDFIWQGHQEIMSALARQGNRVLFVENTGVRAPGLRDLARLMRRLLNWWKGTKGFRQVQENLFVYAPILLPFPYSSLARWVNRRLLLGALHRWMQATGFRHPILWTFLPTPLIHGLIRDVEPALTVYYCIDDFASSSPQARRISRSEAKLFREAGLVFTTSEKLRERAARFTTRVHLFPFGVDFETFERIRKSPDEIPEELRALPRPVVGYIGGIHQWVDQELLSAAAARMPQVSFVLMGPPQTDVSRLARHANIHLLPARPHAHVPRYIKGFDVGIITYRLCEYTAHVYPTKLNEYLAMGIPVVATDLSEISRFNAGHHGAVAIVRNLDEFVGALQEAFQSRPPEVIARRIEIARQNSWSARIAQMSALIDEQLRTRRDAGLQWDTSLRRLYRSARRRVVRLAFGLAAAYLVLFHSSFIWWVAEPLRMVGSPQSADAIVVFAGGVGESGEAGGGYQERVKQAVDLYQQGLAPRMIFSSGYTFVFREAEVMKELAINHGVPASAVLLETKAANTYENITFVAKILRQERWRSILLVSAPYHMRRAILTWRKTAPDISVVPLPVPASQFYRHGRGASIGQIGGIMHEYVAILAYWWRGWI